jgi:hypothetical protein
LRHKRPKAVFGLNQLSMVSNAKKARAVAKSDREHGRPPGEAGDAPPLKSPTSLPDRPTRAPARPLPQGNGLATGARACSELRRAPLFVGGRRHVLYPVRNSVA